MTKKMWWLGMGILIVLVVGAIITQELRYGITPLVSIMCGIVGNKWIRNNLQSRGYECKDMITADNQEGAIALYIKENK